MAGRLWIDLPASWLDVAGFVATVQNWRTARPERPLVCWHLTRPGARMPATWWRSGTQEGMRAFLEKRTPAWRRGR